MPEETSGNVSHVIFPVETEGTRLPRPLLVTVLAAPDSHTQPAHTCTSRPIGAASHSCKTSVGHRHRNENSHERAFFLFLMLMIFERPNIPPNFSFFFF